MSKKIYFESLGCSKNLVDAEIMMDLLHKNKYTITDDLEQAEIAVINTCGFIDSAKEESIQHILSTAKYKEKLLKKLIVTGCLAERYKDELINEMPEIDALLGTGRYEEIVDLVGESIYEQNRIRTGNIDQLYNEEMSRFRTTPDYMAYVKIADGCDNHCTYCVIPQLRGKYRSREIDAIVKEAESLADSGVKEIVLIAQDTTAYGIDIYNKFMLPELLYKLENIHGIQWIRLLYCYPERITDELIYAMKTCSKVCKYLDIPIQHSEDRILKRMNRAARKDKIIQLVSKLRNEMPGITIRTTLIVGFPGETEEEFNSLKEFVKTMKFDKLGVFDYSQEEGTPAATMAQQIDHNVKIQRKESVMLLQQQISAEIQNGYVGQVKQIIVEESLVESDDIIEYIGRTENDAPEIDGSVYFTSRLKLTIGDIVPVRITGALEYDLMGEAIDET
ncbi:MAG: 30S ribosomal protein S12 methylthiotransferase RimO [Tindallia sp. MSAO_Bac2]|nr:MAG: 30S ribosomal protein S12 methylthiotransferase RimO [Tindallia sp. MSAO_Bac2]